MISIIFVYLFIGREQWGKRLKNYAVNNFRDGSGCCQVVKLLACVARSMGLESGV